MLLKKLIGLLALIICSLNGAAQNPISLSGKVVDPEGNPIPNAVVQLNDSIRKLSDLNGIYLFENIATNRINLKCSHTGFQFFQLSRSLKPGENKLDIVLKYRELNEVVIEEKAKTENLQKLSSKDISGIPSATGDFVQAVLGAQAGVAINNELSASYSVRGGSYDENLVYVNGIQVYRPFLVRAGQQEGLSFVNSALVENINFSAGGFSAKYGDKMSSVLDITYKKPTEFEGEAVLGLMGGNLALGNASKDGRWTYIAGFRYRANGLLLGSLETKGEYQPRFWDGQVYITRKLSDKSEISLLNVYSSNRFTFVPQTRSTEFGGFTQSLRFTVFFDGQEESKQSLNTTALQFTHLINEKSKIDLALSHFYTYQQENFDVVGQYRLDETNRDFGSDDFGDVVRNLGVGGFLNHARNNIEGNVTSFKANYGLQAGVHYIRIGTELSLEQFKERWKEYEYIDSADSALPRNPDQLLVNSSIRARNSLSTERVQFYIEDELKFKYPSGNELSFNVGARGHYYGYNQQLVGGPRASIAFYPKVSRVINDSTTVKRKVAIRASGGVYYQPPFYRELRGLDGNISPNVDAQKAMHAVLGAEYGLLLWKRPFKLISEFYYKWYSSLIPYELENVRIRYYGNNLAEGFARGFDLKLHGEFIPGLESWISLGILSTQEDILNDRDVDYLNQSGDIIRSHSFDKVVTDSIVRIPGYIPRPSDQRLRFGMFFKDEMPGIEDLTVQLNFLFGTGLPYGPPDFNRYKDILRTTSYKRVDVGFSKEFKKAGKKYDNFLQHLNSLSLTVEILNLLDAQNIVNHTWIKDVNGNQFAIPNYLTRRLINLRLNARF